MTDREKVIGDLEGLTWDDWHEWHSDSEVRQIAKDAIELLKEQEPKKVTWQVGRAHCPSCGELFPKKKEYQYIRFCSFCGQAVKWNE